MTGSTFSVYIPAGNPDDLQTNVKEFSQSDLQVFILANQEYADADHMDLAGIVRVSSLFSSDTIQKIALHTKTPYFFLYTKTLPIKLGAHGVHRMIRIARETSAALIYSDYYALKNDQVQPNPLIEYQEGSLRDDFNFGSLLLFETAAFIESASRMEEAYAFAGLYDLRLKLSQKYRVLRIPEFLYTETESDFRKSGEKQFDYVDPRNRQVQLEMERACTAHLKDIGGWLEPRFRKVNFSETDFSSEASVIIPVKNREKTIADAIRSVMMQKANFSFNVIVVDNHSTDGTSEIIRSVSEQDKRVIHVIPQRKNLGIGGCWNEAIFHPRCGKFAVQLDSDDLYSDESVLKRIVEGFYEQNCAMLIGSYRMVNFRLEEIPPGIISHSEWTPDNGRNNALRINGLGAPRAFYTPVIRSITVPDVSYGEDYALGLQISRVYQIGRIFEPLYLCRRWEENSDASLDVYKMNTYNFYKDKIRTIELLARQLYIQEGQE
jgi:hypothetical protein